MVIEVENLISMNHQQLYLLYIKKKTGNITFLNIPWNIANKIKTNEDYSIFTELKYKQNTTQKKFLDTLRVTEEASYQVYQHHHKMVPLFRIPVVSALCLYELLLEWEPTN